MSIEKKLRVQGNIMDTLLSFVNKLDERLGSLEKKVKELESRIKKLESDVFTLTETGYCSEDIAEDLSILKEEIKEIKKALEVRG